MLGFAPTLTYDFFGYKILCGLNNQYKSTMLEMGIMGSNSLGY